jgi:hypothetical protein
MTTKSTEELRSMVVEYLVRKWGESERGPAAAQTAKQSRQSLLATLYMSDLPDAADYEPAKRTAKNVARGACDDGVS